jgi:hypothetical protein
MVANAPLIICIVLLIFIIGIFFILIWMNSMHSNIKKKEDAFNQYLKIENGSYSEKSIKVKDLDFVLLPGETTNVTVPSDSVILSDDRSDNSDSSNNKISHIHLDNSNLINSIYITENGIFSNLECSKGILLNESDIPINFIEIGKNGKKWDRGTLYPGKNMEAFISSGSKWEVISPDKKNILASTKVKNGTKIIYNGKHLISK